MSDAIDDIADAERRTEAALERIVAEPVPEPANAIDSFKARMAVQAEAEAGEEARRRRLDHQHPNLPVDDDFRTFALEQRQRRARRLRGRIP